MIKSELQVGYLVQTRNKNLYMVMPFVDYDEVKLCFRHSDKNGILFSDEYLMNLNHKIYNDSDIVKVYGFSENALNTLMFDTDSRKLLWERKEEKENQSSKNDNNRNKRSEKRNLINIPMKIKIGGNIYKIERTDNLKLGSEKCKGEIDYQENIIRLTTGLKMQELEKTLIHEIVHGMCEFVSDRETNEDESKIEQITNLIYMFLRDNKELFWRCKNECRDIFEK